APHLVGDLAARGGRMVQQVPLGRVEIAFADLFAVTVAIGIVEADAGRPPDRAAILAGGGDALLAAGVGDLREAGPFGIVERRRIERLQSHVNIKRRRYEASNRGGNRRPVREIQMAEAEALHFEGVTGDAGETEVLGRGDPFAVLVHVNDAEEWIQIRLAVAVEVLEAAI